MNIQSLIVAVIVIAALAYVGQIIWRKARSFSSKSGCASDCGCSGSAKRKI
ncbi:MAG: FeoB-associated Cys-rich membrane protein [Acidobacteriota bacterium]|nr:FeoB-associated Cys-rich membrane protein [Acidobacteriota bacterium]